MANNVTNTLTANITSTEDNTQNVPINRGTGNPSFDSACAYFQTYCPIAAGDTIIQLPASVVYQWYVKNLDPGNTIVVKITPQGLGLVTTVKLFPGDVFISWQKPGNAGAGITAMTLNASGAMTLVEYFFGG